MRDENEDIGSIMCGRVPPQNEVQPLSVRGERELILSNGRPTPQNSVQAFPGRVRQTVITLGPTVTPVSYETQKPSPQPQQKPSEK